MWKGLTLEEKVIGNLSVSLSVVSLHKSTVLRFFVENDVNSICGWTHVSLI